MNSGQLNLVDDSPFSERLRAYGCTEFIRLDQGLTTPAQLEYLDLLPRRGASLVTAVAEHQGTALLYLVDACGDAKTDAATLTQLQRQLANRSDPAWLGVVRPGSLEIYPIGFHEAAATAPIETIVEQDATAPFFFQSLVHGTFAENKPPHRAGQRAWWERWHLPGGERVKRCLFLARKGRTNLRVAGQDFQRRLPPTH
jgi:hypothetical protein